MQDDITVNQKQFKSATEVAVKAKEEDSEPLYKDKNEELDGEYVKVMSRKRNLLNTPPKSVHQSEKHNTNKQEETKHTRVTYQPSRLRNC